jgi:hypothetical protein
MPKSMVDAEVTITFIVSNVCEENDLDDLSCFWDMVTDRIEEDGLHELLVEDDDYQIIDIVPIQ